MNGNAEHDPQKIIQQHSIRYYQIIMYFSGPARIGKKNGLNYGEWLGRKKAAEQKIIDIKKGEEEKKKLEEEER